jgi:hypothetical protein
VWTCEYAIGQLRQHRNLDRAMDALERIQRTVCDAMIGYADDAGSDEYDVGAWDTNIPW